MIVYVIVFGAGIGYLLRLVAQGPIPHAGEHPLPGGPGEFRTPARPLSAAADEAAPTSARR